jgi:Cu(I)/Ag(I) efflux system protein CusF
MNALSKLAIATVFACSSAATAVAQESGHGPQAAHGTPAAVTGHAAPSAHQGGVAGQMVDGEVKKVDKEAAKITIRHGELKTLGMPAMTMVFRTKDPVMLDQVKAGDKVKFVAEKANGAITLMHLESAQ